MTKNTNRFSSMAFVFAGVAFGVEGLLEGKLSYVALGISFLCIAMSMFYSGRVTADDGLAGSPRETTQHTDATDGDPSPR